MATSAFGCQTRHMSSPQQCYLHYLHTSQPKPNLKPRFSRNPSVSVRHQKLRICNNTSYIRSAQYIAWQSMATNNSCGVQHLWGYDLMALYKYIYILLWSSSFLRWSGWVWVGECLFWYRPTRVVPDQRPLDGRCCCCCCIIFEETWTCIVPYFVVREWKNPGISASNYWANPQISLSLWTKPCTKSTNWCYCYSFERVGWPDLCKTIFVL